MRYLSPLLLVIATTTVTICSAQERTLPKESDRFQNKTDQSTQTLMPTSKLLKAELKDSDGENCGKIRSFIFDEAGKVHYVVVGVGGVAGIAEDEIAVPWSAFHCKCVMSDEKMTCHPMVRMPLKQLGTAPKLKGKNYIELSDADWAAKNSTFYRVDKPASPLKAANMVCSSKVIDKTVKSGNDSVGDLDDLMIVNGQGMVKFAIVGFGGVANVGKTYVALPLKALNFTHKDNEETVVTTTESVKQAQASTKVTPSEYPELNLASVADRASKIK